MDTIEITEDEQWDILSIVASVLHLGNVQFAEDTECSRLVQTSAIASASRVNKMIFD